VATDALARLRAAAGRLLAVVDETLARHGAPEHHPIWPLLRAAGLLPGDAVAGVEALPLEVLRQRSALMRAHHERGSGVDDLLAAPSGWEGAAADAAAARLESARAGVGVLAANAGVLADLLADLAAWGAEARTRLARTLAKVLTSAEAVDLTVEEVEPIARAQAAADIGAEVLAEADRFWAGAQEIVRVRLARLESEPVVKRAAPEATTPGRLAVEL